MDHPAWQISWPVSIEEIKRVFYLAAKTGNYAVRPPPAGIVEWPPTGNRKCVRTCQVKVATGKVQFGKPGPQFRTMARKRLFGPDTFEKRNNGRWPPGQCAKHVTRTLHNRRRAGHSL